jgi:hypothetical protein
VNALIIQWGDLTKALHDNPEFGALYLRAVQSLTSLDAVSKLRFSAFQNRFLKLRGNLFPAPRGDLTAALWDEIEHTMSDFLAYPGMRQQWETRKHWHTKEFVLVVDEIIAKDQKPTTYATYNLDALSDPRAGGSKA